MFLFECTQYVLLFVINIRILIYRHPCGVVIHPVPHIFFFFFYLFFFYFSLSLGIDTRWSIYKTFSLTLTTKGSHFTFSLAVHYALSTPSNNNHQLASSIIQLLKAQERSNWREFTHIIIKFTGLLWPISKSKLKAKGACYHAVCGAFKLQYLQLLIFMFT